MVNNNSLMSNCRKLTVEITVRSHERIAEVHCVQKFCYCTINTANMSVNIFVFHYLPKETSGCSGFLTMTQRAARANNTTSPAEQ